MNIKKALDYMISHSSEEDRPAYKQICSELSGHLELWVKDKERIAELEAENKSLKLEAKEDEELIDKLELQLSEKCPDVWDMQIQNRNIVHENLDLKAERDRLRGALQTIAEANRLVQGFL